MNKIEYLLVCLMEEAAEVQQIAAKALRFGLDNHHPNDVETNRENLSKELDDLNIIHVLLVEERALPMSYGIVVKDMLAKQDKIKKWMNVSRECRILEPPAPRREKG